MDIKKIINLIEKTGDRCVVVDKEGDPAYVILSFSAYEKIINNEDDVSGLSEDQLLEKINRDVATWKESQNEAKLQNFASLEEVFEGEKEQAEDKYYFEPVE